MRAFNGQQKIKDRCLTYQREDNGKFYLRLFQGYHLHQPTSMVVIEDNYQAFHREFGFPFAIIFSLRTIFDHLPEIQAEQWLKQFVSSTKVGADLWNIWSEFVQYYLAEDQSPNSIRQQVIAHRGRRSIARIAGLYREQCQDYATWQQALYGLCLHIDACMSTPFNAAYYATAVALNPFANAPYAGLFSTAIAENTAHQEDLQAAYNRQAQKYLELLQQIK